MSVAASARTRRAAIAILGVALALRLAFVLRRPELRLFWDEPYYDSCARFWAQAWRTLVGVPSDGTTLRGAFTTSLQKGETYSASVGAVYALVGPDARAFFVLQALLDTATCWLVFLTARRLGDARAGLIALAIAALYEPFIFACGRLQTEVLAAFLCLAAVWALVRPRAGAGSGVVAGIVLAAAMLTKPALKALVPVVVLLLLMTTPRRPWRRRLTIAASMLAGFFTVVGPRLVLTARWTGEPLLAGNLDNAIHLYGGVMLENRGWTTDQVSFATPPREELAVVADPGRSRMPTLEEFRRATWRTLVYHPVASAAIVLHKLYVMWAYPYDDAHARFLLGDRALRAFHQAVLALGLLGTALVVASGARTGLLVVGVSVYLWAGYLLAWLEVRYAMTVLPLVCALAGVAASALARDGGRRPLATAVAVGGVALAWSLPLVPARLLAVVPALGAETAHRLMLAAVVALVAAAALGARVRLAACRHACAAVAAASVVALLVTLVGRPLAEPWRTWRAPIAPGESARVRLAIPADLPQPRAAELRIDLVDARQAGCTVAVRVDGRPTAGAPDTPAVSYFMSVRAAQRGETDPVRAWYWVPLAADAIVPGTTLDVVVTSEGAGREPCAAVFGDYPVAGAEVFDGPSIASPEELRDTSLYQYLVTGEFRMRRATAVRPVGTATWTDAAGRASSVDLSALPGRQSGRYRVFLVLDVAGLRVILD